MSRIGYPLVLLTFCSVVVVGCGDDLLSQASGGSQASPTRLSADEGPDNRAPEITEIRFEPSEAIPGRRLRARVDAFDPDRNPIDLGFTWTINGRRTPSSGAVLDVPTSLRRGDQIEVSVIASDGKANSEPSVQTVLTGNRRPSVQEIEIHIRGTEDGKMGYWLADPTAQDPDGDEITFRYSWKVNGNQIVDGDGARLERAPRKRGDEIRLVVWATDGAAESAPLQTAPFGIGNSPPDIDSRPPAMDPSGRFVYAVQASDRDGDRRLRYSLEQGPEAMTIDALSGELRWQATLRDAGEHLVQIAVDDRNGGVTNQTFYVQVKTGAANQN